MENKITISINKEGDKSKITFNGIIDEDANFEELSSLDGSNAEIDWSGVTAINSCGIREWTNCLKKIDSEVSINYVKCPIHIVEQINMIVDFVRKGSSVETFQAPYFCDDCDEEISMVLNVSDVKDRKAPEKKCESCGGELEFDAMEAQYFSFIK